MNGIKGSGNMNLRLAERDDLPCLKLMYKNIVDNMNRNEIQIWDEIYPCEFLSEDIEKKRLYLLVTNHDIIAAFALCESHLGEEHIEWTNENDKALYLERFGVHVDYLRKGIGSIMLNKAIELARYKKAKYLRLFVIDINEPAINLYLKNGFKKVEGIYDDIMDENFVLHEYGFEIAI